MLCKLQFVTSTVRALHFPLWLLAWTECSFPQEESVGLLRWRWAQNCCCLITPTVATSLLLKYHPAWLASWQHWQGSVVRPKSGWSAAWHTDPEVLCKAYNAKKPFLVLAICSTRTQNSLLCQSFQKKKRGGGGRSEGVNWLWWQHSLLSPMSHPSRLNPTSTVCTVNSHVDLWHSLDVWYTVLALWNLSTRPTILLAQHAEA